MNKDLKHFKSIEFAGNYHAVQSLTLTNMVDLRTVVLLLTVIAYVTGSIFGFAYDFLIPFGLFDSLAGRRPHRYGRYGRRNVYFPGRHPPYGRRTRPFHRRPHGYFHHRPPPYWKSENEDSGPGLSLRYRCQHFRTTLGIPRKYSLPSSPPRSKSTISSAAPKQLRAIGQSPLAAYAHLRHKEGFRLIKIAKQKVYQKDRLYRLYTSSSVGENLSQPPYSKDKAAADVELGKYGVGQENMLTMKLFERPRKIGHCTQVLGRCEIYRSIVK
ncbi:unnamed protein product [Cylicocyclus nassatus]|uniref:Uncharacterized protein n=1 Tax=Cylicocyclus nassatus TaxID=53992 RepID=A0AA36DLW0_CYLNA|nr:unnamed protein product [Cylicocyclus nassatus]